MLRWIVASAAGWLCLAIPAAAVASSASEGMTVASTSRERTLPSTRAALGRFRATMDGGRGSATSRGPNRSLQASTRPPDPKLITARQEAIDESRRWAALGASLVPGVLLHGSGSWVLGEREAARRLLYLELAGLGVAGGSLAGLASTGAARALVAPLAALGMFGVGAFGVSFLADVYNVVAPPNGWGRSPSRTSVIEAAAGYTYVHQQQFAFAHLLDYSLIARGGRALIEATGSLSPRHAHDHTLLQLGYRFWGATPTRRHHDGSFLEARAGVYRTRYGEADFSTRGQQVLVSARLDSERWAPQIRGAFAEASLGYARRSTEFDAAAGAQSDDLLLGGFAFGVYHGEPERRGGWSKVYYDHRHDGYTAGLLTPGLGSGVVGHFGLEVHHYLSSRFGLSLVSELGSSWLLSAKFHIRQWGGSR